MYTDAYVDAVPGARIDAALGLALRLHERQPSWALARCVTLAVQHVLCPCVTGAAVTAGPGLGIIQEAIIEEVLRLARRQLGSATNTRER
jgi:hypothetical protein